jgi:hypothetical protein
MSDYIRNQFLHQELRPIRDGPPGYEEITRLTQQVRANVSSIDSDLGGGDHGYLGLVMTDAAYAVIAPGTPFVATALPILDATANTGAQIAHAQQEYNKAKEVYDTTRRVKRSILQQIMTAVSEEYLIGMVDIGTGLLTGEIPDILDQLQDLYATVTPQQLEAAKIELVATNYDHDKSITKLFQSFNDHQLYAMAGKNPYTPQQLINMATITITRANIFQSDIREWNDQAEAAKTWPLFQTHFHDAQKAIKKSQPDVPTDSLGFHEQANAAQRAIEAEQQAAEQFAEAQMAAQIQQNVAMAAQMEAVTTALTNLENRGGRNRRVNNREGRGGRNEQRNDRTGRGGRNEQGNNQTPRSKYCWTHGNCGHSGNECNRKAPGHLNDATYANMQGGCTLRCFWL